MENKSGISIAGLVVGILFSATVAFWLTQGIYERKAIEHGCAEYDTQTGEWGWK